MAAESAFLRLGLTGDAIEHSLSPRLHAAALQSAGLEGEYCLYPMAPFPQGKEPMAALLGRLRSGELDGLNVTLPHKQTVIPMLDELTPAAAAIGAVNTMLRRSGRLVGDNTDGAGFMADLRRYQPFTPASGRLAALVLGAGGAARAAAFALAQSGWWVWVASRRPQQAEALAASLAPGAGKVLPLALTSEVFIRPYSLVVNATPLGSWTQAQTCPWPLEIPFYPPAFIYDLVYNPPVTTLAARARSAGLRAAGGLGMLVEQAARSFEAWTGCPADRCAMLRAVEMKEVAL